VVNGSGTGARSRLDLGDIKMAGKTGTAQVRRLISRGSVSDWKARDHSLFVCYAPAEAPRYAMAVVVEHGTFGARAAAPIARDVMTCLFDPAKAWADLAAMEKTWGGTPTERMNAKYAQFAAAAGIGAPPAPSDPAAIAREVDAEARATQSTVVATDVVTPPPETDPAATATPGQ
jgi:penicillin-binding protein 2